MNTWEGHLADTLSVLERDVVAEDHTAPPPLYRTSSTSTDSNAGTDSLPDDEDDIARPVAISVNALADELRVGHDYAAHLLGFLADEGRATPLKAKAGVLVYKRAEDGDESYGQANVTVVLSPRDGRETSERAHGVGRPLRNTLGSKLRGAR